MSTLRLVFLGTSAAVPQKDRYLSSIALQTGEGEILLFDCGEGTQYQVMRFNVNYQKITKIFLSHLHGDHIFGLFGLLNTMNLMDRERELIIYGPPGTRKYLKRIFGPAENLGFSFPIEIKLVTSGLVCDEKDYSIYCQSLLHSVLSLGYAFIERDRPGRFYPEKARKLNIPKGDKWNKLQEGESVLSKNNKTITPEMVMGEKRRGYKIVIAYDGRYDFDEFISFAKNADVLVLEATFSDEKAELAKERLHSTARESAKIAAKADAHSLYLTHISPRENNGERLLKEAKECFSNVYIAHDGLELNLNWKDLDDRINQ
ncbi:MAG: ribonuclease Z [Asgard group archaeon]|nr:ribonuclease Z [Asgard group archaeon]